MRNPMPGVGVVAVTVAALLCGACSGSSPAERTSRSLTSPTPSAAPTTTSPPTSPPTSSVATTSPAIGGARSLDEAADPLPAGRYTKPGFVPALSFRVGAGWHAVQDVQGLFDVQRQPGSLDVIAVQFARPTGARTARAAVALLRNRHGLVVRTSGAHRIGDAAAVRIVVDNADPDLQAQHFTAALTLEAGTLSLASGRRLQIDLIDTSAGLLAILVGGSVRHWSATQRVAEPVVQSVLLPAS